MMSDSESKAATDLEERVQRLGRNEIAAVVMEVHLKATETSADIEVHLAVL